MNAPKAKNQASGSDSVGKVTVGIAWDVEATVLSNIKCQNIS